MSLLKYPPNKLLLALFTLSYVPGPAESWSVIWPLKNPAAVPLASKTFSTCASVVRSQTLPYLSKLKVLISAKLTVLLLTVLLISLD